MNERTIMDLAGDVWCVEAAWEGKEPGTRALRCRHELGYELLVTLDAAALDDDDALVRALERTRRSVPAADFAEAA